MKVLAIESSCDDTAAAVVCDAAELSGRILSNVVHRQNAIHAKYGGVVPEHAARGHLAAIDAVVNDALAEAGVAISDVDAVAATAGPGLIGGLLVGMVVAKTIAAATGKPFMAVNHLEGHLLTVRLCGNVDFPYLLLLASGGNFFFAEIADIGQYKILGQTLDDAAGEAFDKVAKVLGLPYPGGPSVEKAAEFGDKTRFTYTMPLLRRAGCDASFSGLKTAVSQHVQSLASLRPQDKYDIAAAFQDTVARFIVRQLSRALDMAESAPRTVVVAGGVAANKAVRAAVEEFCTGRGLAFNAPPMALCTDNAAMIGWAAIERMNAGLANFDLLAKARPRWPITEI